MLLGSVKRDAGPRDAPLLLERADGLPCKGSVDLHPVNEDRDGDKLVGRDLLEDAVGMCANAEAMRDEPLSPDSACTALRQC